METPDICSLELESATGQDLPAFSAGSHIDVHIGEGLVRQYSLCNSPWERDRYVISVLREPASRGGSAALHDDIGEGSRLRIGEPRNCFPLEPLAARSILLAGGIGITPMLAMAEQLHGDGAAFELHYCTRSARRTAFRARLEGGPFSERVSFHISEEGGGRLDLSRLLRTPVPGTMIYGCGPARFLDSVSAAVEASGWPAGSLRCEHFAAAAHAEGDASFEVRTRSGKSFVVPHDRTVLEVLGANGVEIPSACEAGVCGTCLTGVLGGEIDHRDHFLTEQERAANDRFMPCCSRAKSRVLILDL